MSLICNDQAQPEQPVPESVKVTQQKLKQMRVNSLSPEQITAIIENGFDLGLLNKRANKRLS